MRKITTVVVTSAIIALVYGLLPGHDKMSEQDITRENFLFTMYTEEDFLHWDAWTDLPGARGKIRELFPAGTPLSEFERFAKRLERQQAAAALESKEKGNQTACFRKEAEFLSCHFTYVPGGAFRSIRMSTEWIVTAFFDSQSIITNIDVERGHH